MKPLEGQIVLGGVVQEPGNRNHQNRYLQEPLKAELDPLEPELNWNRALLLDLEESEPETGTVRTVLGCFNAQSKIRADLSKVSKRGWRTEGVGAKKSILCKEIEASFPHHFSYAPSRKRGTHFWRTFFRLF